MFYRSAGMAMEVREELKQLTEEGDGSGVFSL